MEALRDMNHLATFLQDLGSRGINPHTAGPIAGVEAPHEFHHWVVLGGMRNGSNLLEEHLAAFPDITVQGDLFVPHFFGHPKQILQFGPSMTARESDPVRVTEAMQPTGEGMPGFGCSMTMGPTCREHPIAAKIILTRRPTDS